MWSGKKEGLWRIGGGTRVLELREVAMDDKPGVGRLERDGRGGRRK